MKSCSCLRPRDNERERRKQQEMDEIVGEIMRAPLGARRLQGEEGYQAPAEREQTQSRKNRS
jgi:hypothetical protein